MAERMLTVAKVAASQYSDTHGRRRSTGANPRPVETGFPPLLARIWHEVLRAVWITNKPQALDLGFRFGAGDENRTRALSLGINGLGWLDLLSDQVKRGP
jgi:hypothetical protein